MAAMIGQRIGVAAQHDARDEHGEVLAQILVDTSHVELVAVHRDHMLGEAVAEGLGAHIQHAGLAVDLVAVGTDRAVNRHERALVIRAILGDPVRLDVLVAVLAVVLEDDEGHVGVGHLKRAMEELAGVDRLGMHPLHLLEQADGEGIRDAVAGAGGHRVDELVVLVLGAEGLRALGKLLLVRGKDLAQLVAALDRALILLVRAEHVEDAEDEAEEHAVVAVARIGLGAPGVGDRMLGRVPQRGIHLVGEADRQRALVARQLGGAGGLQRVAGMRAGHHKALGAKALRATVDKLIGVEDKRRNRRLPVKDILSGIEDRLGAAAGHKIDVLDFVSLDCLEGLVQLLDLILIHAKHPPSQNAQYALRNVIIQYIMSYDILCRNTT